MSDELFKFAKDKEKKAHPISSWKILVVDDDEEVHAITRAVLKDFEFEGKDFKLIHAHSAKEAMETILEHEDTALILLDVVMETDDAGLTFVQYVRNDLNNKFVRIVLRTGQPGQAPQREVVVSLDINDYKEKTDLTVDKLFTTVIAAIRSYRDLINIEEKRLVIEQNRKGLKQIIDASASLFEIHSLREFAKGALVQLISILKLNRSSFYMQIDGLSISKTRDNFSILAATGKFAEYESQMINGNVGKEVREMLEKSLQEEKSIFFDEVFIGYFKSSNGIINIIYVDGCSSLNDEDKKLIDIYSVNVSIAFENLYLDKEILDTQFEAIELLSNAIEFHSKESSNHVKRVCEYTYYLSKKAGLSEQKSLEIKHASALHDIGNISIPNHILLKTSNLTDEEFDIVKSHPKIGYEILKKSQRATLKTAAIIALEHHEKYDGSGYPKGLKGDDISIYGRIISIADSFDVLLNERCYKDSWSMSDTISYMKNQRGIHFDPELIDLFLSDMPYLDNIIKTYSDDK